METLPIPPPLPVEQSSQAAVVQGTNGINGMDSHQVIQMQPLPHTQLPQPSFFGGGSVFHAMLDGAEEDDPAVI